MPMPTHPASRTRSEPPATYNATALPSQDGRAFYLCDGHDLLQVGCHCSRMGAELAIAGLQPYRQSARSAFYLYRPATTPPRHESGRGMATPVTRAGSLSRRVAVAKWLTAVMASVTWAYLKHHSMSLALHRQGSCIATASRLVLACCGWFCEGRCCKYCRVVRMTKRSCTKQGRGVCHCASGRRIGVAASIGRRRA